MFDDVFKVDPVDAIRSRRLSGLSEAQDVQSAELNTAELTPVQQGTDQVALQALERMKHPHPADSLAHRNLSLNPVVEALKLTGAYETLAIEKMGQVKEKISTLNRTISLAADLSQELALLPPGRDKYDLSEKALLLSRQLGEIGLHVFKDGATSITKEELVRTKSVIDSGVSQARTEMQKKHTDIQTQVQFLMSILETMKKMLANHDRLMGKISQNTGGR